ncbi:hypothetical protein ACFW93_29070 [Streptomyces canus]|uniref:hypothetical protein n=1 Tax=Streptomyces canus TaxID=58343 RepID=UPI00368FAD92
MEPGSAKPRPPRRDTDVLRRSAAVVVGDPATVAEHAEPVVNALRAGLPTELVGLGDVLTGRAVARAGPRDIVHYDSVGLGTQDAAAAKGESR